jgi:membrane-associated phospholipid phosphatase
MPDLTERSIAPCKPIDCFLGAIHQAWRVRKERLPRLFFWIGLCLVLLTLAFLADGPVARIFTLHSSTFWHQVAIYSSKAGEGWVIAVAGSIGSLFLFLGRRFQASRVMFLAASTGLLTGAIATFVRSMIGRTRPDAQELQGFYGVWHDSHWIIGKYEFGAFPSGHAATVIGLAAAAWLMDRRLGMLAAFYALLVSWSRIALNCHHFSDAVAAAILGIYGAHLILIRLQAIVDFVSHYLRETWLSRKSSRGTKTNGSGLT